MSKVWTALCIAFLTAAMHVNAQEEPQYRWEVGAGVGLMTYTGDLNSKLFASGVTAPEFSLVLRHCFNPYSHLRFTFGYGTLKGSAKAEDTFYPDLNTSWHSESARPDYEFSNGNISLNAIYEYNFWPYGTGREYRGAQPITPFIAFGFGFNVVSTEHGYFDASTNDDIQAHVFGTPHTTSGSVFTANVPLGIGVKYKASPRLNMQLEWLCHFTLSDKLDGVKDPYRIVSSGIFKNTDCYSTLQLAVTYSFGPKCKTCMNSDWRE